MIGRGFVMTCAGGFVVEDEDLKPLVKHAQGTEEHVQGMNVELLQEMMLRLPAV